MVISKQSLFSAFFLVAIFFAAQSIFAAANAEKIPTIEVTNYENDSTSTESTITIVGRAYYLFNDSCDTQYTGDDLLECKNEKIEFSVNGEVIPLVQNNFSYAVELEPGLNTFYFEAIYQNNKNRIAQVTFSITYDQDTDTTPPEIIITTPVDGDIITDATTIVSGTITDDTEVDSATLNGELLSVNADGTFSQSVTLIEGLNSLAVVAIDTASNTTTESVSVTYEEPDTDPPVIIVNNPTDGQIFTSDIVSIQISGSVTDNQSISELTLNGDAVSLNADGSFSNSATLITGENIFTLVATDASANTGELTFTVSKEEELDTEPPVITLTSPTDGQNFTADVTSIQILGSVADNNDVSTLTINGNAVELNNDASFTYSVGLVNGINSFVIIATDAASNVSQSTISVTKDGETGAFELNILSPVDGAQLEFNQAIVTGTIITDDPNTALFINGLLLPINTIDSEVEFSQFVSVRPDAQDAQIYVRAATSDGREITNTISVVSEAQKPTEFSLTKIYGIAPLQVTYSFINKTGKNISHKIIDFNNDNVIDYDSSNSQTGSSYFNYEDQGIYKASLDIYFEDGTVQREYANITVVNLENVKNNVQNVWSNINSKLIESNVEEALSYVTYNSRERYRKIFTALSSEFPTIISEYRDFQYLDHYGSHVEYSVNRTVNDVDQLFVIKFSLDVDGIWRLSQM